MELAGFQAWSTVAHEVRGQSCRDVLQQAGLDWDVCGRSLGCRNDDDSYAACPGYKAICREDTGKTLGVVGSKYPIYQNRDLFAVMDQLPGLKYTSAGELSGGRIVFVEAELGIPQEVVRGDNVQSHILLVNKHGGGSISVVPMSTRLACWNRVVRLTSSSRSLQIPHRGDISRRLSLAMEAIEESRRHDASLVALYQAAAKRQVTVDMIAEIVRRSLPAGTSEGVTDKAISQVTENMDGERQKFGGTTLWTLLNAVTEYADHNRRAASHSTRIMSNIFGASQYIKQNALTYVREHLAV